MSLEDFWLGVNQREEESLKKKENP